MNRRDFLQAVSAASAVALAGCAAGSPEGRARQVMTVRGPLDAADLGFTLEHEHILANFQTYEEWARAPLEYRQAEVEQRMLPYLSRIASLGCNTFIGYSRQRRRGVMLLGNFLWQPIDAGTIGMGVKMIDPDFPGTDFNLLYPH